MLCTKARLHILWYLDASVLVKHACMQSSTSAEEAGAKRQSFTLGN